MLMFREDTIITLTPFLHKRYITLSLVAYLQRRYLNITDVYHNIIDYPCSYNIHNIIGRYVH